MRRSVLTNLLVVGLLATSWLQADPAEAESEPTVALRWALGAQPAESKDTSAVRRDTELSTGTRLKFLVEPLSHGSFYLILMDSSDAIEVLYRQTTGSKGGDPTYVPSGSRWFELDDESGRETFFLLASVEPLVELSALLGEYDAAAPNAAAEVRDRIVAEIRRLHRDHRNFARPVETPVIIGGQIRGDETSSQAIDRLAVEINAARFYGKTITIDH